MTSRTQRMYAGMQMATVVVVSAAGRNARTNGASQTRWAVIICNCGSGAKKAELYKATFADGSSQTYSSETAAQVAVAKKGGSYKKV